MQEIVVTTQEADQRFHKMLSKYLHKAPKGFVYKMLRKKNIVLNGKKAAGNELLRTGDVIQLFLSDETIQRFSYAGIRVIDYDLDIVFENEEILILNKAVGILSQKAKEGDVSLVEQVLSYLVETKAVDTRSLAGFRPSICNRLDRNTSGLITVGKTLAGAQAFSKMFQERSIQKYYLCIVVGTVAKKEKIQGYLYKNKSRNQVLISQEQVTDSSYIETEYIPLVSANGFTLLYVHLLTGKSHQIRAHLASCGYPLLGDYKYGRNSANAFFKKKYGLTAQLLHAHSLILPENDGVLKDLSFHKFVAAPPELFRRIALYLGFENKMKEENL
ncbi:MAG: RluA family pseudouridine synthase [Lachnospiraceae bacterium]|nr:RluA family pseudouridine synthase [Lachnospiraceae bacterium]